MRNHLPVIPVDLELLGSIHSFQGAKTLQKAHDQWRLNFNLESKTLWEDKSCHMYLQRHFTGPCDKLEEFCPICLIKAS